jgi:hypothetical protein
MNTIETYIAYKFKAIILSKITIKKISDLPRINKLSFFFFLSLKKYKKNLLLFFIVMHLFFNSFSQKKKKEVQKFYVVFVSLKKKKWIQTFFLNFLNVFLAVLPVAELMLKYGVEKIERREKKLRLNYFHFPRISELEILYAKDAQLYIHTGNYKFQMDISFFTVFYIKDLLDFLLRMYRLPYYFKKKFILN